MVSAKTMLVARRSGSRSSRRSRIGSGRRSASRANSQSSGDSAEAGADDRRRRPAEHRPLADRVEQRAQAEPGQHQPEDVEAPGGRRPVLGDEEVGEGAHDDPERDVDQEHPAPGERLGQHAAEDRRGAGPDQDRQDQGARDPGPLLGRVGAVEHRGAGRGQQAAADALQGARGDQLGQRLGEPAERRGDGEEREREDEGPLGPEPVADPARRRDHDRQRQQVGDHRPLHVGQRHPERFRQRRQRDVDDLHVDPRHEDRRHVGDRDRPLRRWRPPRPRRGTLGGREGHRRNLEDRFLRPAARPARGSPPSPVGGPGSRR